MEGCRDSVLVEKFVTGREFTVGLLETGSSNCGLPTQDGLADLPIAEIQLDGGNLEAFNSFERKIVHRRKIVAPADIPDALHERLVRYTRDLFRALGCRDRRKRAST